MVALLDAKSRSRCHRIAFFFPFYLPKVYREILIQAREQIQTKIPVLRGRTFLIGSDLTKLQGIETKGLNQAVKRNLRSRFPDG